MRWHLLSFALMASVWGCAPRGPEQTQDGRIILDYWEKWTGFEADAMREIVDLYNDSQSRFFVRYLDDAGSQIDTKLLISIAGGTPPAIAGFWSDRLPDYVLNGALTPLDGLMERDGIDPNAYLPAVMDCGRYEGQTWGLPLTPMTLALHYNRALFREAGLDPDRPPRTIAELDDFARRLTRRDESGRIVQLGFSPDIPGWYNNFWPLWFGASIWDGEGRITANSPETVACLEWIRSIEREYSFRELDRFRAAADNFDSPQWPLFSGRLAMVLQGPWMANYIARHAPDLDWAAAPFPAVTEEMGPITFLQSDLLVIPRGCPSPEGAWDFIRFTQRQENLEQLCRSHCKFSPLRAVSEAFYAGHPNPFIRMFASLAVSPGVRVAPPLPRQRELQSWMWFAFDEVYRSGCDPADALARVAAPMQSTLDRALRVAAARRGELSL